MVITKKETAAMQERFVEAFAAGATQTEAARQAGYSTPDRAAYKLMRNPGVRQMIRDAYVEKLLRLERLANDEAIRCIADPEFPPGPRVQLIKSIWTQSNNIFNQSNQELMEDKPLSERSRAELEAFVKAGVQEVARLRGGVSEQDNTKVIKHLED